MLRFPRGCMGSHVVYVCPGHRTVHVPGRFTQHHGDPISRDAIVVTTVVTGRGADPSPLAGIVEIIAKERRVEETSNTHSCFR